eukprot:352696-Chlamydomonas_euryale.AAC.3
MNEASAGLEITGGVSPPDRSVRAGNPRKACGDAHNKANKRRPGRPGHGGRGHGRMSNAQQPATAEEQVEHVQET